LFKTKKKLASVIVAVSIALVSLSACGKGSVDVDTSGATKVEGTDTLHRFCDESTLIYVSIITGDADEYEAFFYGGCTYDKASGKFLPAIGPDVEPRTSPTDSTNDEMNQQDERQTESK
jgi:hypothetical protein